VICGPSDDARFCFVYCLCATLSATLAYFGIQESTNNYTPLVIFLGIRGQVKESFLYVANLIWRCSLFTGLVFACCFDFIIAELGRRVDLVVEVMSFMYLQ
jgi:hypothetical protein